MSRPDASRAMALVVSGQLNKQAAVELGISEKTIKVHRQGHGEGGGVPGRRWC